MTAAGCGRSSLVRSPRRASLLALALATLFAAGIHGCAMRRPSSDILALEPESPEQRAMQTRVYETSDATELLSASAAVLQDLGFHIEESTRPLGFLRASKERSARERGQELVRLSLYVLSLGHLVQPVDLHQRVAASLIVRPVGPQARRHEVRVSFYRVVWQGEGQFDRSYIPPGAQRMERIRDSFVHQQFFAKLSKAVFLEPFKL